MRPATDVYVRAAQTQFRTLMRSPGAKWSPMVFYNDDAGRSLGWAFFPGTHPQPELITACVPVATGAAMTAVTVMHGLQFPGDPRRERAGLYVITGDQAGAEIAVCYYHVDDTGSVVFDDLHMYHDSHVARLVASACRQDLDLQLDWESAAAYLAGAGFRIRRGFDDDDDAS